MMEAGPGALDPPDVQAGVLAPARDQAPGAHLHDVDAPGVALQCPQ